MDDQTFTAWRKRYDASRPGDRTRLAGPGQRAPDQARREGRITRAQHEILSALALCPTGVMPTTVELSRVAGYSPSTTYLALQRGRELGLLP
jgi:hypothetical protein